MHEKVKEFLAKKQAEEQKKYAKEKERVLESLGIVEKEYSNNTSYTVEYPYYEWGSESQSGRYYKKNKIDVTDEEYEMIKKYNKEESYFSSNTIATFLTVIAVIVFVIGFIGGIVLGNTFEIRYDFNTPLMFATWVICAVNGIFILGFAEIIKLLQAIKDK